jgi:predicted transglutaminase-like cysteine proteinase
MLMSPDTLWRMVEMAQWRTYQRFTWVSDQQHHGVREWWPASKDVAKYPSPLLGDCDDYALACRVELREAGVATRLLSCVTARGTGHLVCEAGGWILDCQRRNAYRWDDNPLRHEWRRISGYETGDPWREVVAA